jgi:heme-degrading monooxygenase HmoA
MIARIWKGRTKPEHFEEYTQFMRDRAIPDYKSTEGFVKLTFLRRRDEDFAYFELITFWQNMEVIKNFAGDDHKRAKYYPEDKKYLIDFPEEVTHFEVFANERLD